MDRSHRKLAPRPASRSGLETQEALVRVGPKGLVSGVSIDEEVSNLVREQHSFNDDSRLITTAEELFDTIINRMGAGR